MHRLAILRAGGWPVKITAQRPKAVGHLDGLVVGGGDDIGFHMEDGQAQISVRYDPQRDVLEKDLLEKAFARDLPVLGVCRGAQMLNLVRGGSLFRDLSDIAEAIPRNRTVLPRKTVSLVPKSRLAEIMRCNPCRVNALHHQAIDRPGDGLRIVAKDDHGIVQAVEAPTERFTLGVQWHPELLPLSTSNKSIFRALIRAAA